MSIKIEKNVPMPDIERPADILKLMVVGDSIVISETKLAGFRNAAKFLRYKLRTSTKEVAAGMVRVWRDKADKPERAEKSVDIKLAA